MKKPLISPIKSHEWETAKYIIIKKLYASKANIRMRPHGSGNIQFLTHDPMLVYNML